MNGGGSGGNREGEIEGGGIIVFCCDIGTQYVRLSWVPWVGGGVIYSRKRTLEMQGVKNRYGRIIVP